MRALHSLFAGSTRGEFAALAGCSDGGDIAFISVALEEFWSVQHTSPAVQFLQQAEQQLRQREGAED